MERRSSEGEEEEGKLYELEPGPSPRSFDGAGDGLRCIRPPTPKLKVLLRFSQEMHHEFDMRGRDRYIGRGGGASPRNFS